MRESQIFYGLENSFRGYKKPGTGVLRMRIILIYHNHGGGSGSAVRGSVKPSAPVYRPFTPWEYKDTTEKVEPYRGTGRCPFGEDKKGDLSFSNDCKM